MERGSRPSPGGRQHGGLNYNVPLRSMRGGPTPSPLYNISAELSKESLKVPGAVPFQWEQTPGCRKPTRGEVERILPSALLQKAQSPQYVVLTSAHDDQLKKSAGKDFEYNGSHNAQVGDPLVLNPSLEVLLRQDSCCSGMSQIACKPARVSNSSSVFMNPAHMDVEVDEELETVSETAFTASDIVGLSTMEDMCSNVGTAHHKIVRAGDDVGRDLILHRFLPAAHAIACDSPNTPSRRHAISVPCSQPSTTHSGKPIITSCRMNTPLVLPSIHDDLDDISLSTTSASPPSRSMKACGLFPLEFKHGLKNLFVCLLPSVRSSKLQHLSKSPKRQKKRSFTSVGPQRLSDMIVQEDEQNQDLASLTSLRGTKPDRLLSHYYDASCRFSPCCTSSYCTDSMNAYNMSKSAATSPFLEGMGFLGLPKDQPNKVPPQISASEYCSKFEAVMDNEGVGALGSNRFRSFRSVTASEHHVQTSSKQLTFGSTRLPDSSSRFCMELQPDDDHVENGFGVHGVLSPPPLPKSPTESWLSKAMAPGLSAMSPNSLSSLSVKTPLSKHMTPASGASHAADWDDKSKWESIVKDSHALKPGHLRFSEVYSCFRVND